MMETAIIPTEMEKMLAKDEQILNKLKDMKNFLIFLDEYFIKRLKLIEQDKWLKRKAELRREVRQSIFLLLLPSYYSYYYCACFYYYSQFFVILLFQLIV